MGYSGRDPHRTVPITVHDLRALLHWATVGVRLSEGGSYADEIVQSDSDPGIIRDYAQRIKFQLPGRPVFKQERD